MMPIISTNVFNAERSTYHAICIVQTALEMNYGGNGAMQLFMQTRNECGQREGRMQKADTYNCAMNERRTGTA